MTSAAASPSSPVRLLVLGGTSWLGGAVAVAALRRGHDVTCLARGVSGSAPDGVRFVEADRWQEGAYDAVATDAWDSVLDVSWQPELVRGALEALAPRAGHWLYVSSGSVYADDTVPGRDESDRLHEAWSGSGKVDPEEYGPAKVACEQACLTSMGADRALLARAGLIVGYGDRSDRFGYWPARVADAVAEGRPVLVPPRAMAVQVIDVEDLADWLVLGAEQHAGGVFNAVGDTVTMAELLAACDQAVGTRPRYVEATDAWLTEQGVEPWSGKGSLPLWLPAEEYAGFNTRAHDAASHAGLVLRPVADTVRASLAWERELGLGRSRQAGLSVEREAELLERLEGAAVP